MIFFRDKKGRVYLQRWDAEAKRGRILSRDESRHMDAMTDDEIRLILRPESQDVAFPKHEARKHRGAWKAYLEARRLDRQTVAERLRGLDQSVFPFFIEEMKGLPLKDWSKHTGRFYNWMVAEGRTAAQIRIANTAMRKFFKWLAEENIPGGGLLHLRSAVADEKGTPLLRPVGPEEILEWAEKCESGYIKFMGLAGYFFSLRPQELFALTREAFRNGPSIQGLESSKAMVEAKLYGGLAVYIQKQRQNNGSVIPQVKKGSKGWVVCFNERAARMIVEMLLQMEPNQILCKGHNSACYIDWKKHGIPGLTIKDLRRASLYWLGHNSKLLPLQLMKHARHKNIQTTMLYCRRPEEVLSEAGGQLELDDGQSDFRTTTDHQPGQHQRASNYFGNRRRKAPNLQQRAAIRKAGAQTERHQGEES